MEASVERQEPEHRAKALGRDQDVREEQEQDQRLSEQRQQGLHAAPGPIGRRHRKDPEAEEEQGQHDLGLHHRQRPTPAHAVGHVRQRRHRCRDQGEVKGRQCRNETLRRDEHDEGEEHEGIERQTGRGRRGLLHRRSATADSGRGAHGRHRRTPWWWYPSTACDPSLTSRSARS